MYGWLIESAIQDERGPYYLCAFNLGGFRFDWKPDSNRALRFARREDAENARDAIRELCPDLFPAINPMPQARQHAWVNPIGVE
jgi:hypothetical protein